jgi:hypothetical protein
MTTLSTPWASLKGILFAIALLSTAATGQARPSALRGWGGFAFDTGGREGTFTQVSASVYVSAVMRSDGRIFVNGQNNWAPSQVPPLPPGRVYVDMDITPAGGVALMDDGNIVVWGLYLGTPTLPPAPSLPPGVVYVDVDSGGEYALALRSDGVVVAWGSNVAGQCNVPPIPPGQTIVQLVARSLTSYLVLSNGSVIVFGDTQGGIAIPPAVPPGIGYARIYAAQGHWLGLRTDGQVEAWGANTYGQCNVPPLPPGTTYTAIAGGSGFSFAARSDGLIVGWGALWGLPMPPAPTLPPGVYCTQLACGQLHMIALLSNGKVITWGLNWFFQGYVPSLEEEQGSNPIRPWFIDASVNLEGAMAVLSTGRLVGWGNVLMPPAAIANNVFTRVEYGCWHHAAMTASGDVLAWGDNSNGKASIPPLPPGTTYVDFACAAQHTVLVRSDGQAIVCGPNQWGEGNVPALPSGVTYVACDAHEGKTVLLRSDGQALSFGQPTWPNQNTVPPLPPGLVYTDIAASRTFNTALRSDGTAIMFGSLSPSSSGWRGLPTLPFGVYFVAADGGEELVALRRSDGRIEVCGQVDRLGNVVPDLDPGTSYVQASAGYDWTVMGRVGAESTYLGIAHGCAGSRPTTKLVPQDTPKLGRTLGVILFDLPVDIAVMAMGFQQLPAPVSLAALGMPGCDVHISIDAMVLLSGQGNQAKFLLPIPDQATLLGLAFYNQALVFDPQAGNGFGAVASDAARGVVGDW